jgi:hypothetical protein
MAIEAVPCVFPQALSQVLSKLFVNLVLNAAMLIERPCLLDVAPESSSADKITSSNCVKLSWVWRVASLIRRQLWGEAKKVTSADSRSK